MKSSLNRIKLYHTLIIVLLLNQLLLPPVLAQSSDPVSQILASMTVEEKVGQLFIVPFVGSDTGAGSDIATLITQYKVGGVVLQASNSNFRNTPVTPQEVAALTNSLQAYTLANKNIPLFVAIDQEGDDWPYTRITGGVTPLPSAMSIGATWDPENARAVGNIVGRELSAMGVNVLLGPVLDVLNDPRPTGKGDIGTRTFGGDPFWVGLMGQAYIQGVHEGSNYTVATVAKHFPGHGGSDRLPDSEVATVDKSLQELKRIELAPFFSVTNLNQTDLSDSDPLAEAGVTDAMMSSHIRYRGLQGDIRQFTAPISFDANGMKTLLQLAEFKPWRDHGGLIVSDALGVPAVRKHYDPTLQTFPHRRIAREAFLAGNDILILAQFDLNSIWSRQFENIKDTVEFFQSEYRNNQEFAQRVDQSVARILRLKFRLFPNPGPNAFFVDGEVAMAASGQGMDIAKKIAQESLTLLYPTPDEYSRRLARPPALNERLLIISDVRRVRECYAEDCEPFEPLPYRGLEEIILSLYGPETTSQILPENVTSMSFAELKQVLVGSLALASPTLAETEEVRSPEFRSPEEVLALIQAADWIIFAAQDLNTSRFPNSDALKLFLAQGFNSPDKKIIVLALNSPYYLDTTEINKLTAYLALYSKTRPHLEVAVRALFGEADFPGASPVTIDGISYDLTNVLVPDPIRSFPLQVSRINPASHLPPVTVSVQAGPILDRNGHPVPDGSPVTFETRVGNGPQLTAVTTTTVGGLAGANLILTDKGTVEITAHSGDAQSQRSQLVNVESPLPATTPTASPTTIPPSPTPSPTETLAPPTATPMPASSPMVDVEPSQNLPSPSPAETLSRSPQRLDGSFLLVAFLGIILSAGLGLGFWQHTYRTASQRTHLVLITFIAGMGVYLAYGVGWFRPDLWLMPDAPLLVQRLTLSLLVLVFGLLGNLVESRVSR